MTCHIVYIWSQEFALCYTNGFLLNVLIGRVNDNMQSDDAMKFGDVNNSI
jgi:hypothetical protein